MLVAIGCSVDVETAQSRGGEQFLETISECLIRDTIARLYDYNLATFSSGLHDHDDKYGGGSDRVFEADGMAVIKTPIATPRANSHIERQIGSTRRECIDWLLILNRRHLERVLTVWFEHYNQARPHRGLDLQTPIARSDPVLMSGPVTCDKRLGGLLREYSRSPLPVAA